MSDEQGKPEQELEAAREEVAYYRRIAGEAGRRRLREAEELSRLLDRAQQAERELQRSRDELEERVAERTAALGAANARVEQAQRLESLGVLAGGIAHDFNNLLTAILANAAMLRAELPAGVDSQGCLADVEAAARTAAGLCGQMLTYSGRAPFTSEPIDLGALVRGMVQLLRSSVSRRLELDLRLASGLPRLHGDPTQLRQLVMNLVINGAEAIGDHEGRVTVTAGEAHAAPERLHAALLGEGLAGGAYVCLEVADTGCGMDAEAQRRIFEPFFTSKFAGRGLGLSVVLGIVKRFGGAIELESAPGRGSLFRVFLPLAEGVGEAPSPVGAEVAPARAAQRGEGLVLVVDDDEAVRRALRRLLSSIGFEVLEAEGGAEAVELYRKSGGRIQAVVLDLTMPRMDGVEALRELRRVDPAARVLVASGFSAAEVRARFVEEKPEGFVQKPFELEGLRDAILAVLDARAVDPAS